MYEVINDQLSVHEDNNEFSYNIKHYSLHAYHLTTPLNPCIVVIIVDILLSSMIY